MRNLLLAFLFLASAGTAEAAKTQVVAGGTGCGVVNQADLALSKYAKEGTICTCTDCNTDCDTSGGTDNLLCYHNGSGWVNALAGGGSDFLADGSVPMTGTFKAANGSELLPGITFNSDQNSGLWRVSEDIIALSTNGVERARWSTTLFTSALDIIISELSPVLRLVDTDIGAAADTAEFGFGSTGWGINVDTPTLEIALDNDNPGFEEYYIFSTTTLYPLNGGLDLGQSGLGDKWSNIYLSGTVDINGSTIGGSGTAISLNDDLVITDADPILQVINSSVVSTIDAFQLDHTGTRWGLRSETALLELEVDSDGGAGARTYIFGTAGFGPETAAQLNTGSAGAQWANGYMDRIYLLDSGSASAPAIRFDTIDTNTGYWWPGADILAASVGGVEGWRLDSTGLDVALLTETQTLEVEGTADCVNGVITGTGGLVACNATPFLDETAANGLFLQLDGDSTMSGALNFATNGLPINLVSYLKFDDQDGVTPVDNRRLHVFDGMIIATPEATTTEGPYISEGSVAGVNGVPFQSGSPDDLQVPTYTLGSSEAQWRTPWINIETGEIVSGPTLFAYGTVGAPGISFAGDGNTGIYRYADGVTAITSDGTLSARFDADATLGSRTYLNGSGPVLYFGNAATYPSIARNWATGSMQFTMGLAGAVAYFTGALEADTAENNSNIDYRKRISRASSDSAVAFAARSNAASQCADITGTLNCWEVYGDGGMKWEHEDFDVQMYLQPRVAITAGLELRTAVPIAQDGTQNASIFRYAQVSGGNPGTNGFGYIDRWYIENAGTGGDGTDINAAQRLIYWGDSTNGSEDARLIQYLVRDGSTLAWMNIETSGEIGMIRSDTDTNSAMSVLTMRYDFTGTAADITTGAGAKFEVNVDDNSNNATEVGSMSWVWATDPGTEESIISTWAVRAHDTLVGVLEADGSLGTDGRVYPLEPGVKGYVTGSVGSTASDFTFDQSIPAEHVVTDVYVSINTVYSGCTSLTAIVEDTSDSPYTGAITFNSASDLNWACDITGCETEGTGTATAGTALGDYDSLARSVRVDFTHAGGTCSGGAAVVVVEYALVDAP